MANTAYNLPSPLQNIPVEFNKPEYFGFTQWLYSVYTRITNGIKLSIDKNGTAQSITDNTSTKLTWATTNLVDTVGGWNSTNNRYIVQIEGTYFFTAVASLAGAISGGKLLRISLFKNGVEINAFETTATTTTNTTAAISAYITCSPRDYIEVYVKHTVGGATNITGTSTITYFQGHRIN